MAAKLMRQKTNSPLLKPNFPAAALMQRFHDGKTEGGDDNPCGTERILIRGLVHFDING